MASRLPLIFQPRMLVYLLYGNVLVSYLLIHARYICYIRSIQEKMLRFHVSIVI